MLLHVWRARVKNRIHFYKTLSLIMFMIINSVSEPFSLFLSWSLSLPFFSPKSDPARSEHIQADFVLVDSTECALCLPLCAPPFT